MFFGEIVEPSTRALWEDDLVDYSENEGPELQWSTAQFPNPINKLIIGETSRIVNILDKCVVPAKCLNKIINTGISLYEIENNSYVVTYKASSDDIKGKITEKLFPLLKSAKEIYALTSASINLLQNYEIDDKLCVIQSLPASDGYSKLKVPNLVTGLSASVLSYCVHKGYPCTLYIGYLEEACLDSLNTKPLINLLKHIGLNSVTDFKGDDMTQTSNLYM